MPLASICLIEDDTIMGESIHDRLLLEGYQCDWFQTAEEANSALKNRPYHLAISDIRLPDMMGDMLFSHLKDNQTSIPPFIFLTAYSDLNRAVSLMKDGAIDYITKPFDFSVLLSSVYTAIFGNLIRRTEAASTTPEKTPLGISESMRHFYSLLPRLAEHASTVLITGESGVGKEHIAKELHLQSRNKNALSGLDWLDELQLS